MNVYNVYILIYFIIDYNKINRRLIPSCMWACAPTPMSSKGHCTTEL